MRCGVRRQTRAVGRGGAAAAADAGGGARRSGGDNEVRSREERRPGEKKRNAARILCNAEVDNFFPEKQGVEVILIFTTLKASFGQK